MPRRVTAPALARSWLVLKVIVADTPAEGRWLEQTPPIAARPVNGGTRLMYAFATPTFDSAWLDQHQRFPHRGHNQGKTSQTDGQLGEGASSNEPERRVGGAEQESRAGALDASPGPIGPQPPS